MLYHMFLLYKNLIIWVMVEKVTQTHKYTAATAKLHWIQSPNNEIMGYLYNLIPTINCEK